jgi:hypothetical protein
MPEPTEAIITTTRARFCQRLTPHPVAGVRVMCCLGAYEGIYSKDAVLKLVDIGMTEVYLGDPDDQENINLAEFLSDHSIADMTIKTKDGMVIIHNVRDINEIIRLEKEIGFWIDGTYDYDFVIGIE